MNRTTGKEKKYMIVLIVVISTAAYFLLNLLINDNIPKPQKGYLDLTKWNTEKQRPSLAGDWEFYWNKLYSYSDFQTEKITNMQYVQVPKTWNNYQKDGHFLPGSGYATYRLHVRTNSTNQPLSLRLDTMATAYRIFINEKEIASSGQVGRDSTSSVPDYEPQVVNFRPETKKFDIIVQVSNYTYARGGIWYEINLGTQTQIEKLNTVIQYKDAFLIGSLLIMALYYISFYIVLQRDRSSYYFILLCILFIVRTSLYGSAMIVRLIPDLPYEAIIFLTYGTLYWIPIVLYLMLNSIYESPFSIKKILLVYGVTSTLLTLFLPIRIYTSFISVIEFVGILIVMISLYLVIRAHLEYKKGSRVILLSTLCILIAGIHDVLFQGNMIQHNLGEMASFGIFIFILSFSYVIASRLSDAYKQEQILTHQLGESLSKEKAATEEMIQSELSFLKAQIKPHFLYNSLSVIAALSTKNPEKTKELLYDLSDYLRGSFCFENYDGVTPITSEIATVKAYLSIEKVRFQGKLNIVYEIDETITHSIPLLTIQPLVENALRHGILRKSGGGTIHLCIRKTDLSTIVEVRDNGIGMSDEKIRSIFEQQGEIIGVGLRNIHRRLLLHYGQGLQIVSQTGSGTVVTFSIPREGDRFNDQNDISR